ncbi:MAG: LysR family transcriptional regulator [Burkholderiaceae bacterium]|nr:LysR family transcriptional regulator [Burkholderiales bacterium]MCZ8098902.1 LysR family transcriptional regulator [Burkholderiales bacterium]MCZ8339445.1 LysR family transcriptional regulator [Burkholderiaceae bacterium]
MKLPLVRAFVLTVDHGGIRAAARAAGISQVALAKQLREFETQSGRLLFTRSTRGARPTPAAIELLPEARLLLEQVGRFEAAVGADRLRAPSVALNPLVSLVMWPAVMEAFVARAPGVRLRLAEGLLSTTIARLRDGTLDFAVVAADPTAVPPDLAFEPILNCRAAFAVRHRHPLLGTRPGLDRLSTFDWVQNEAPGGYSDRLKKWFKAQGAPLPRMVSCDSLTTALGAVTATEAVACAPAALLAHPCLSSTVSVLEAELEPPRSTLGFLDRRGVPPTSAVAALQQAVRSACAGVPDAIVL